MLTEKILAYIIENKLFVSENSLLVAVSGGRDSVMLLDILVALGYQVGVAHCNFQLRGAESDEDEAFVRKLATQYQVPFFTTRFETTKYATEKGVSIQISARELRYAWFEKIMTEASYDFLVTAHHLNDNVETILHRWVRGTGIMGLQGIPQERKARKIVRPLLGIAQAEIAQYVQEKGMAWREDSSNAQDKYTRNLIRHQVVPVLQTINPNFEQTFLATLERIQGAAIFFQEGLETFKQQILEEKNKATYLQIAPLLAHSVGKVFLGEILQSYNFLYEKTHLIWQKMLENARGTLFLSASHSLVVDRAHLVIKSLSEMPTNSTRYELAYGQTCLQTPHFRLDIFISQNNHVEEQPKNIIEIDKDTLTFPLVMRKWKAGDFFLPLGMGGKKKKVSDFLNEQKVPRNLKADVWVLCAGETIVWVVGYRMAHPFRLTAQTKESLKLVFSILST